jgi:hypothetical protein
MRYRLGGGEIFEVAGLQACRPSKGPHPFFTSTSLHRVTTVCFDNRVERTAISQLLSIRSLRLNLFCSSSDQVPVRPCFTQCQRQPRTRAVSVANSIASLGGPQRLDIWIAIKLSNFSSNAINHNGDDSSAAPADPPARLAVEPAGPLCTTPWGQIRPI